MYKDESHGNTNANGVTSVFQSRTTKGEKMKILNETVQYFTENEDRYSKKIDSFNKESRGMRWT